jgi:hypothetical protein
MYVLYYASMLRCWQLVCILVRTNYTCLGVECHIPVCAPPSVLPPSTVTAKLHCQDLDVAVPPLRVSWT